MSTDFIYDWGQTVCVATNAPENMFPGKLCSVCGMRKSEGHNLYLVEFGSGNATEVPEHLLKAVPMERIPDQSPSLSVWMELL